MKREWAPLLEKYQNCTRFNALPRAGGMNDQDWFEMRLFSAIHAAESTVEGEQRKKTVKNLGPLGILLSLPQLRKR